MRGMRPAVEAHHCQLDPAPKCSRGYVPTSQTKDGARNKASDGMVPVIVLLAQVGRGNAGELEGAADGSWDGRSARHGLGRAACAGSGHTKGGNDAAVLGEGGPRADVLLGERVPHSGKQETAAAKDHAVVDAGVDGIFGMIVVVPGRRHVAGWWWLWVGWGDAGLAGWEQREGRVEVD